MLKKASWRLERSNNMERECKVDLSFWKNCIKEKKYNTEKGGKKKRIIIFSYLSELVLDSYKM